MVICPFAPYGLAYGPKTCQICRKFGPDFAGRISLNLLDGWAPFKVSWTFLDLYLSTVIVICPFQVPHMGLPMGQKLVKSGSTWTRPCGTHIFETAGWIYTIQSSMELSTPVVVQHQDHLTLTYYFQGQILRMLYLRNGRADWHRTKGMWVDRMLHPHCDFELWPHPWTWPLIFKVKFWKCCFSRMEGPKGMWVDRILDPHCDFELWPHQWPWPLIFKVKFLKNHNSRMGC